MKTYIKKKIFIIVLDTSLMQAVWMLKDVPRWIHERTFRCLANIPAYFRKNQIDPNDILVHPQNVRFQNVRFHNVRFQNVLNVRFTKRQLYKTSGLQNVRFTKRQVFKTSGCKKTSIYILYLGLVEILRFCCSHVCRQREGCVLFSILEWFFAIYHHNR